ncbi:helix-turn-helix domain-containing protein [Mucilaginibacter sp. SG564]|uniref:helix-turn-helix domain-containing protein n=1 Tax=Mucilaginibacter sp. SG564 TaxID=2587022 RepID=UPI001551E1C4|nr:helix-turn-helix domain-containing protein [Mucilaginibacter sp. SG564]NOW96119.1 AraC-like DNA-binding protein [Mucilaginibacter sp. SG564]
MVEIFDNIRKTYNFASPSGELYEHIEFYGETCVDKTSLFLRGQHYTIKMFPSWTPTIYLNLGAPYRMIVDDRLHLIEKDRDVLILRDSVVERLNQPDDHIFIVKFNPGGLEAVLGISQLALLNKVVDLRSILPHCLISELRSAESFSCRCRLIDAYLLNSYRPKYQQDHYFKLVQDVIDVYVDSGMQLNNAALSDKFFTTSKTVNRYFRKVIGITPKKYFSTLRARTALTSYMTQGSHFNPYAFGYFDHSHFYRDVAHFTGQSIRRHDL